MIGRLHSDIFFQQRYMLNEVNTKIRHAYFKIYYIVRLERKGSLLSVRYDRVTAPRGLQLCGVGQRRLRFMGRCDADDFGVAAERCALQCTFRTIIC